MVMMIARSVFVFLSAIAQIVVSGQSLHKPVAAPYIGLGAYGLNHVDVFSFTSNQASLAQIKAASAGVYGERRFMLSELSDYVAALTLPTRSGNFGLKGAYSGYNNYNETQVGLAYARKLGKKADLGVQFNYNGMTI